MRSLTYILITAAYNEEKTITKTIESVISQTVRPVEWVLVSDGSVDATDAIIARYAKKYSFIRFFRIGRESSFSFSAKVKAVTFGLSKIKTRGYDYFGIVDADISLGHTYFEDIIRNFEKNPRLGVGGGNVVQYEKGRFFRRLRSYNSVAGAVQFFRKECFASTEGFLPIEYGGEDAAIEIAARMNGWEVKTFPEIIAVHHGITGKGAGGILKSRFKNGKMYFMLGYHPAFEIVRCLLRVVTKPYVAGSGAELAGFFAAALRHRHPVPQPRLVEFLQMEQLKRLKSMLSLRRGVAIGY